jgi:hypothetical protein
MSLEKGIYVKKARDFHIKTLKQVKRAFIIDGKLYIEMKKIKDTDFNYFKGITFSSEVKTFMLSGAVKFEYPNINKIFSIPINERSVLLAIKNHNFTFKNHVIVNTPKFVKAVVVHTYLYALLNIPDNILLNEIIKTKKYTDEEYKKVGIDPNPEIKSWTAVIYTTFKYQPDVKTYISAILSVPVIVECYSATKIEIITV